jgi:hypothetical protein
MFASLQGWDWWLGLVLFVAGVLAVIALAVGYFVKVVAPQYPSRSQRHQQPRQ